MIQLGTRWRLGDEPPRRLPQPVIYAIDAVESGLAESALAGSGADTSGWNWTLTWLEGKPVCELDDGTLVEYDQHNGEAIVVPYNEEDED